MKEGIWKVFDAISPSYDRINAILSFGQDRRWRQKAAAYLPDKNVDLLDIASGTGDQLIACLESKARIRSAAGIDLSSEMLKIAQTKIAQKPYSAKVKLQRADALHLPFPPKSFDACTTSFGIRNIPDPLAALAEMHRVLKPQGRGLILEFSLPPKPIRPFHLLYLRHILPKIGAFFSKHESAYRYLNETIETFPYGEAFCRWMKEAGFSSIRHIPLSLGAVALYIGDKR